VFKYITPGRSFNHKYKIIYEDVKRNVPSMTLTLEEFHKGLNTATNKYKEENNGEFYSPLMAYICMFVSSVKNFLCHFSAIRNDFSLAQNFLSTRESALLNAFGHVKDRDSYFAWEKLVSPTAPSMAIKQQGSETLADLFA
jgi:hypothetical protein